MEKGDLNVNTRAIAVKLIEELDGDKHCLYSVTINVHEYSSIIPKISFMRKKLTKKIKTLSSCCCHPVVLLLPLPSHCHDMSS
uniref:Uncharacterized protein n=1 Tax=Romanomermis culicivorax TaxID=13658 RepID=A0A915ICU3_ROMCU